MSHGGVRRLLGLIWVVGLQLGLASSAAAQSGWTAQLVLSPLPSPYLSDWEVDPTIGEMIVTNGTGTTTDITFLYTLTRNGQLLLRGTTDPQTVPAGQAVTFNATSSFGGRADWDRSVQDQMARTGRLPEGDFEACVTVTDPGGFVLVERQCVRFTTQYPDPPSLIFPLNNDTVTTQDPIFEWLPVQLPPQADGRIGYVLQIAEVNTAGNQRPAVALESNILHYVEPELLETSHTYPVGALPLAPGRTYAWRVQALDGEGRPVASNQGRSEVWTFVYREPEVEVQRAVASIALTPRRDTLRYVGDTARYEVKAYDADNVEIPGKRVAWTSLDTNVVRVDTLGVVTGVAAGETRIVASVEGVTDSALSVTSVLTGLAVGFERYDAATDQPSLLELITSGSYDDVVPKLMELLQSGEFRIPFPRLPGVLGQQDEVGTGGETGPPDGGERESGPRAGASDRWRSLADETCENVRVPAEAVADRDRQVWVVPFRLRGGDADLVRQNCMQVNTEAVMIVDSTPVTGPPECTPGQGNPGGAGNPPGGNPADTSAAPCGPPGPRWDIDTTYVDVPETTSTHDTVGADVALFGVSWATGLPRVFIAWKPPGDEFAVPGTSLRARYWVFNLLRAGEVGSKFLPTRYAGFFGDDEFDVGVGLTLHIKRRCGGSGFCDWVRGFYDNPHPEFTIQAFAGVTAAELSYGTGGAGSSTAVGFNIQASLPVRTWDKDLGGVSLDSTQVGLIFAAQDSVENPRLHSGTHNVSIGAALTLTVWWSTPHNEWTASGSIGAEWDPGKRAAKVVVALQLEELWKFWWVRIGNPQLILTRTIRADPVEWTLEIGGTVGAGTWDGEEASRFGLDDGGGGGDLTGDIGGAVGGGGIDEIGRGKLMLTLTKAGAATAPAPGPVFGPLPRGQERPAAPPDSSAQPSDPDGAPDQRLPSHAQPPQTPESSGCPPRMQRGWFQGWCTSWSARVSVGPTALMDLFLTLGRLGISAAVQ